MRQGKLINEAVAHGRRSFTEQECHMPILSLLICSLAIPICTIATRTRLCVPILAITLPRPDSGNLATLPGMIR